MTTTPQVQTMLPEEAAHILATNGFKRQRRVRPAWVEELADIICNNTWAVTTITFAECKEDGRRYLVDGYHRLTAVVRAGIPVPLLVFHQDVDTVEDVGLLYSRLDRGLQRSVLDGLVARDFPTDTQLSATVLRAGVAAVNVIRAGYRTDPALNARRGYDEKFQGITEWVPELRLYTEAVAGGIGMLHRRLYATAILAVGLTVFRHQPEKAQDFFHSVATGTNISADSAKQAFINKLLTDADKEELTKRRIMHVSTATICRYVAACWNAHYEDKPLKIVRVYAADKPIVILGTPLTAYRNTKTVSSLED